VAELFVPNLDFSTYLTSMKTRTEITNKLEEQINDSSLHNRLVEAANSNLDVMFAGFSITIEETEGDISAYEKTARVAIEHLHKSQSEMAVRLAKHVFNQVIVLMFEQSSRNMRTRSLQPRINLKPCWESMQQTRCVIRVHCLKIACLIKL
jgi:hypothetical protein